MSFRLSEEGIKTLILYLSTQICLKDTAGFPLVLRLRAFSINQYLKRKGKDREKEHSHSNLFHIAEILHLKDNCAAINNNICTIDVRTSAACK